jgi:MOB kinase activator 1
MGLCGSKEQTNSKAEPPPTVGKPEEKKEKSEPPPQLSTQPGEDEQAAGAIEESYSFWDRNKTFKPVRNGAGGREKLRQTLRATLKATLGGGDDLKSVVLVPEGEDVNEWIAVNTLQFYNAASMIYGTCAEFCTEEACPTMSAGPKYEYLWKDGDKYPKPTRVPAPVYIDNLLNWVNAKLSDPVLFPVEEGAKFPKNFLQQVKQIYKRLFRLYGHIYFSHFEKIRSIGANAHLNTCFKHFVYFILEFQLVSKEELAPLKKLIVKFAASAYEI